MERSRLLVAQLLAVGVLLAACSDELTPPEPQFGAPQFSTISQFNPEKYIVVFRDQGSIPASFAAQVEELGGVVEATYEPVGAAIVSGLGASSARRLARDAAILHVELEPILSIDEPVAVLDPAEAAPASSADPASAYFYPRQWNHRAISADVAWAAGRLGSPSVTVAILDTGIDYLHYDTYGLVDLSRSTSFVAFDDFYVSLWFPGRHYVTDLHYHGTHVAATIASNAWVAAGVTSQVTLMGVKVCSFWDAVGCPGSSTFSGFVYAVENGADVINVSLGGDFTKKEYPGYVSVINRLFNYAKANRVTVVVSAGNDSVDLDHDANGFKTYCDAPNVICVSATGPTSGGTSGPWPDADAPAYYTNFGRSAVSVAAPGGSSGAAVWAACSTTSYWYPICRTSPDWALGIGGTSMAAPHVSALAALLVEEYGRNPGRIKAHVQKTADDLGRRGTDPYYGKGRINVAEALDLN